jgi:hypothetical protein
MKPIYIMTTQHFGESEGPVTYEEFQQMALDNGIDCTAVSPRPGGLFHEEHGRVAVELSEHMTVLIMTECRK